MSRCYTAILFLLGLMLVGMRFAGIGLEFVCVADDMLLLGMNAVM